MHTASQLATVAALLQYLYISRCLKRLPVGLLSPGHANAEPLPGHRISILQATDADVTLWHTTDRGQPLQ